MRSGEEIQGGQCKLKNREPEKSRKQRKLKLKMRDYKGEVEVSENVWRRKGKKINIYI